MVSPRFILCALVASVGCSPRAPIEGTLEDERHAREYLEEAEVLLNTMCLKTVNASWNYGTNLTEHNKNETVEQNLRSSALSEDIWKNITLYRWTGFTDPETRTIFRRLSTPGSALLPGDQKRKLTQIVADMSGNHGKAKICPYRRITHKSVECNVSLTPGIMNVLENSMDYDELLHVWNEWRKVTGKPVKEKYLQYVQLQNEAALLNGFDDASGLWKNSYEYEGFEENMKKLWTQLKPLYTQLHAYVRATLYSIYPDRMTEDGPIPAHLLGDIHSQKWRKIGKIVRPYPGRPNIDITEVMKSKNMTVEGMFKLSEEFFTSLGLPPMPESFWKKSVLVKPTNRDIVCHPSAWDFCGTGDVRIKQCTQVKMKDLLIVHHEMGHVEYYLKYAKQPIYFRRGANPGFHEAIGDTIALSVSTPEHLKAIGLLEEGPEDKEADINYLYSIALDKVAGIPSTYLYDLWRWNVFKGKYKPADYNTGWWDLLYSHQGICPGVPRTSDDFDPPSKYHISASVPYIRYFVSKVLQFQFYKSLCEEANHTGPLHKCDFYQSKKAGKLFGDVLALGSSKPWQEALAMLTKGKTKELDARPLLEFFQPLYDWLLKQNKDVPVGWRSETSTACPQPLVRDDDDGGHQDP